MTRLLRLALAALGVLAAVLAATGEEVDAPARLDTTASALRDDGGHLELTLALSGPAPWRVRAMADPPRLLLDIRGAGLDGLDLRAFGPSRHVVARRMGDPGPGWSRLVLDLARPLAVESAGMETGTAGGAQIRVRLRRARADEMRRQAVAAPHGATGPTVVASAVPTTGEDPRPVVVLDPGHGGLDPGAVRDGHHEADIVLAFAHVLRERLRRDGRLRVELTREDDRFLSLEGRIAAARRAGADVFLSIHADAVAAGIARGAQVYTLSEKASSRAGRLLAERHNRSDLLAGVDLSDQDDRIARVLMGLARTETEPRTDALAHALVEGLRAAGIRLHARPREGAAFAVLKAPDVPSALVEIGFMSSPGELEKLLSREWRIRAADALAAGLEGWIEADAARGAGHRR